MWSDNSLINVTTAFDPPLPPSCDTRGSFYQRGQRDTRDILSNGEFMGAGLVASSSLSVGRSAVLVPWVFDNKIYRSPPIKPSNNQRVNERFVTANLWNLETECQYLVADRRTAVKGYLIRVGSNNMALPDNYVLSWGRGGSPLAGI